MSIRVAARNRSSSRVVPMICNAPQRQPEVPRRKPAMRRWGCRWAISAGFALIAVAPISYASDFLNECLVEVATYPVVPVAWIHGNNADAWPERRIDFAGPIPISNELSSAIPQPPPNEGSTSMTSDDFDGDVVTKSLAPLLSLDWLHSEGATLAESIAGPATDAQVMVVAADTSCAPLLQQTFNLLQTGEPQSLCRYQGKVLLIVNTASYCGYTKQYQALEALYRNNKDRGLVVIGFPSNDFGGQEPGTNKEVAEFCRTTYGVEFPMYEKSSVSAAGTLAGNPLYAALARQTGKTPQWNFHKYLVDRSGAPVASFGSATTPDDRELAKVLERLLNEKATPAKG